MAETSNPSSSDAGAPSDPVTGLHRMSTTAGVGSQEYVAINGTAISSVFFGIASLLALFGNALLVVPVVGIICGLVAVKQIRNSGGTQSGQALAWGGVVLALGIGGWIVGAQVVYAAKAHKDRGAIVQVIEQLGERTKTQEWDAAYELFSTTFQARVGKELFVQRMKLMRGNDVVGALQRTGSNNLVDFNYSPGLEPRAVAYIQFFFDKTDAPAPQLARFRKTSSGWRIDDIGELFVVQTPPQRPAP